MLTICWIASSCPTIIRRRLFSRDTASRPVFPGSKGMFSRTISATFLALLRGLIAPPFHRSSGNPSAISLDAPSIDTIRALSLTTFWLCGPDFDLAHCGSLGHDQQGPHDRCDIFGMDFPILSQIGTAFFVSRLGADAARQNRAHPDIVIPCIQ